jgi:hypothetical protein
MICTPCSDIVTFDRIINYVRHLILREVVDVKYIKRCNSRSIQLEFRCIEYVSLNRELIYTLKNLGFEVQSIWKNQSGKLIVELGYYRRLPLK